MDDLNKCLGRASMIHGRWIWPWKHLEVGQWFFVRHDDLAPEELEYKAQAQSHRLNRVFEVTRLDELSIVRRVPGTYADVMRNRGQTQLLMGEIN